MSENKTEWDHDSLETNDSGEITGSIFHEINDRYYVTGTVVFYQYEIRNETKTNYVPHVVISEYNGGVVEELHNYDSLNPDVAIDNVKNSVEHVVERPEDFIEV